MTALEDNGFLYMLVTVLVEMGLVALLVHLVRKACTRIEADHHLQACADVIEVAYLTPNADDPGVLLREQLTTPRHTKTVKRLAPDPAKVAEWQTIIARNNAERMAAA